MRVTALSRTYAFVTLALIVALAAPMRVAANTPESTLQAAIGLAESFAQSGDVNVTPAHVAAAEAIMVIPNFQRFGLKFIGMFQGLGVMLVRADDNTWSDPVFVYLDGGSIGGHLGMETVDFVIAVMTAERVLSLLRGTSFGIGGEVAAGSAAASGSTIRARPELYLYARSRGAIVGVGLRGATLYLDEEANDAFYGPDVRQLDVLRGRHRVRSEPVTRLQAVLKAYERS